MRAGSLPVVVREEKLLQQAGSRKHHWLKRRAPKTGESHFPAPQQGQVGKFCRVATGRAGKECPVCSRSQATTEIPTSPLPRWR